MPTTPISPSSLLPISCFALLLAAAASPLAAQSGLTKDPPARDTLSAGDARTSTGPGVLRDTVVAGLRSPLAAGALDLLVPIAGHAYAGRWTRGIAPAAVSLASLAVAVSAAGQCTGEALDAVIGGIFQGQLEEDPCREEDRVMNVALVVFAASRVWGAVSAALTAEAHNRGILEAATLDVVPRGKGAVVAVAVHW